MSRSVWSLMLCFLALVVCGLTGSVRSEGLWGSISPINVGGFLFAPGSQSASTSETPAPEPAEAEAPFSFGQALEQVAESALGEGQSQAGSGTTADIPTAVGTIPLIAKSPKSDLGRQLWQARISIAGDAKHSESKNALQRIIEEISSVDFGFRQQVPEPLIVVEPIRETDPNETLPAKEMSQEAEPVKSEYKLPYRQVTDATLQSLKSLSQHPEQLQNPFELGEILFSSHCLAEAAKCYQEAISRMTAGETGQALDMAWMLFQTGNCLREDDPAAAIQMYEQLIAQHPASPWASLAKVKSELVGWYLKDTPDKLIDECKVPTL